MPIDPNIALQVKPLQLPSAADAFGKVQALQAGMQRQQLNAEQLKAAQLENQQAAQAQQDQVKIRQAYVEAQGDPDRFHARAIELGVGPDSLMKIQKANLDQKNVEAQIKAHELPVRVQRNDQMLGLINSAMALPDDQYMAQWPTIAAQASKIDPELKLSDQPLPKGDLQVAGLHYSSETARLKAEEAAQKAAEEKRRVAKEAHDVQMRPLEVSKATADARTATDTAAGNAPVQPAQKQAHDDRVAAQTEETRHNKEQEKHAKAMEGRMAQIATAGLSNSQSQRVLQIANQFDNEPIVKNYNVIAEGDAFVKSLGTGAQGNAGDDQALLYAFAKVMDPGSVVREGEYATVQKYSQSWAQTYGFNAARIFSNSPFLSDGARKQMKDTIGKRAATAKTNYDHVHGEYGRRIEKQAGVKGGTDYITDYGTAFSAPGSVEKWGFDANGKLVKQ